MFKEIASVLHDFRAPALERAVKKLRPLSASLEDIAEPIERCACGNPTPKTFIDYEYDAKFPDGSRVTIAKILPGYRCDGCGVEYQDEALSDQFLALVSEALSGLGDTRLASALRRKDADPQTYTAFSKIPLSVLKKIGNSS